MKTELSPSDREIISVRVFDFPVGSVWNAWSDPALLAEWWGPDGFTNTFEEFDFRPGGHWRFVMHGPDGTDHPNHSVFSEIHPQQRIVFDHVCAPVFQVTATFLPEDGRTRLTFHMLFETAEVCAQVKVYAVDCNEQNFNRLQVVLENNI